MASAFRPSGRRIIPLSAPPIHHWPSTRRIRPRPRRSGRSIETSSSTVCRGVALSISMSNASRRMRLFSWRPPVAVCCAAPTRRVGPSACSTWTRWPTGSTWIALPEFTTRRRQNTCSTAHSWFRRTPSIQLRSSAPPVTPKSRMARSPMASSWQPPCLVSIASRNPFFRSVTGPGQGDVRRIPAAALRAVSRRSGVQTASGSANPIASQPGGRGASRCRLRARSSARRL